jgi:hypothetical protein
MVYFYVCLDMSYQNISATVTERELCKNHKYSFVTLLLPDIKATVKGDTYIGGTGAIFIFVPPQRLKK